MNQFRIQLARNIAITLLWQNFLLPQEGAPLPLCLFKVLATIV